MTNETILRIARECGAYIHENKGNSITIADNGVSGSATEFVYSFAAAIEKYVRSRISEDLRKLYD